MHFFIETTNLPVQDDALDMKFGPDSGDITEFNITTQFQLPSEIKAFACQGGMMVVQENSDYPGYLVNLILKPSAVTSAYGLSVKYYVYRGIKLSSFFFDDSGTLKINPQGNTNNSELIEDFWAKDAKLLVDDPLRPNPTPLNFGFGSNTLPLTDPTNLNEDRAIEDLFNNKAPALSVLVTEGMWIGDFAFQDTSATPIKIGFEVVLNSEVPAPTSLKYFRSNIRKVLTNGLAGLELKRTKENILSFIDPAAFFGMHYKQGTGVDTSIFDINGDRDSTNRTLPGSLYTQVVSKFSNRNRVYLDLRSERGLSYNFYDNYKISVTNLNNIRLNGAAEADAISYGTDGWPLLFFDSFTNQNASKNKVRFRLRINGNTEPVLFIQNKDVSYREDFIPTGQNTTDRITERKNFFAENAIKVTDTGDANHDNWTREITLYYPHVGASTTPANGNLAYHLTAHYFIGEPITTGNERLRNAKYYDSAFCSIDLDGLGDPLIANEKIENPNPIYIKEALQTDGTGNFYFAAQNGAYWDDQKVLFYSKSTGIKRKADDGSEKKYLNTFRKRLTLNNTKYTDFGNSYEIICRQYERSDGVTNIPFRIIGINCFKSANNFLAKEDLMLLGITPTEFQLLKDITGLSPHHPRYIFLEPDAANPLFDETALNHRYHRYTVNLQGVDVNGIPTLVNTALIVNSRDNQFFCSETFGALEDLSDGFTGLSESEQNRIEFHIYHNGSIKINDNIDLALLRKSVISDEHNVVDDTAIAGDLSLSQKIHYLHYAENSNVPVEICNFDTVTANKMKRQANGGVIANLPAGFNLSISYTAGDARRTYTNNAGDIVSDNSSTGPAGTLKRYNNQKKKVFMVHFVTDETTNDANHNIVFNAGNNDFNLSFVYSGSRRRYVEPALTAAMLGAMIRYVHAITSTGFGFGDASAYPSAEHVNGTAMDSIYFQNPASTWQDDVDFIEAMDHYGVQLFRIGMNRTTLNNNLSNEPFYSKVIVDTEDFIVNQSTGATLHDSHLHSAYVVLNT